ncbi:MAG: hypothetical protein K0Q77_2639 [Anaerosporomusa subterranea]|nr:hypothetical protein [Anaerosporomusa subterranea]
MGEFHLISNKQCILVMAAAGIVISIVAALIGFEQHALAILYGTLAGISFSMLLKFQYQKGLETSAHQAVMNVNNGFISRFCVVVAFILFGEYCLDLHIIAVLAGLFVTQRIAIVWQVFCLAFDQDTVKITGKENKTWRG